MFGQWINRVRLWPVAGAVGMVVGILGWGAFNTALELTNTMDFCISCHEMKNTVYQEYLASPHYQNPSGVRATCPDCHVPRDWTHKVARKIQASGELFHWLAGSIDTPAKFEAKRHDLAKREWDRMRAADSRECRNCHSFEAMAFHKQSIKAARAMRDADKAGKTCVDCHRAVAHKMPDVTARHRKTFADLEAGAANVGPAAGDTVWAIRPLPLGAGPGASADGQLAPGASLRVVAVEAGFAQVELAGWRRQETPTLLYARQGQRELVATLAEGIAAALVSLRVVEDADTGQVWSETRLETRVPLGGLLRDPAPLWAYAAQMQQDNCTLCHPLHSPGRYTANDWVGHVNLMKRTTPLTEQEAATLLAYLQAWSKEGAGGGPRPK
jgi:trimethylamine-N-oxide reductase cytochrome c-type subunit TorC